MNQRRPTKLPCVPFDPELDVIAALNEGDDERLWRTLRQVPDEDQLLRVIADEAPRMLHSTRTGSYCSELLLVPVIEKVAGTVINNEATWMHAEKCFAEAVRAWQGHTANQMIFRGVRPYEWIAAWEPSALRQHLLAAVPGVCHRSVAFHPRALMLPGEAPRLGFVVISVGQRNSWPRLPAPSTLRDARFRAVAAEALASLGAVEVLPPDQLSTALADGLCLWLAGLHEAIGIREWNVALCTTMRDAVTVSLKFEDAASLDLIIRRCQVAPVGIDCVGALLASIAPKAEKERGH